MSDNFLNHPCFNEGARKKYGRVHLPVAPRCNIQCNFCNRNFDCVEESRPGVTSKLFTAEEAREYFRRIKAKLPDLSVMGIAGPGDPFANSDETIRTLEYIREDFPEMLLCVATNGLNLSPYVTRLAELKVSHVTITINAVDPDRGGRIYSWVRHNKKVYWGREGAEILLAQQMKGLSLLKALGITVKINSIIIPGINDDHIADIAEEVSRLGADIFNAIPIIPVKDTPFEKLTPPAVEMVQGIRRDAERFLPQMNHCTRCRADAVGLLGEDLGMDIEESAVPEKCSFNEQVQSEERPFIAVASREGILVNSHLGEAEQVYIYKIEGQKPVLHGIRKTPAKGEGRLRWVRLAGLLKDCSLFLVEGVGENPKKILKQFGIEVLEVEGIIDDILRKIGSNRDIRHLFKRKITVCGMKCNGSRGGCA